MNYYPRILITGCARSGNTLVLHLLGAGYRNVRICYGERIPERSTCQPGWSIVGKRPLALLQIDRFLAQPDMGVVFTIRDPRDCICSKHVNGKYWVKPERWAECAEIICQWIGHPRVTLVRFEQLIQQPEQVQAWLGARLGLTQTIPWVECWQTFDGRDSQGIAAMHGARPLDAARIGHWRRSAEHRKRVADAFANTPELHRWMQEFGYERPRDSSAALPMAASETARS